MKMLCATLLSALFTYSVYAQYSDSLLTEYQNFLKDQNTSAKDYVLGLFKTYDIVVLCERDHREWTQYDLILDIVADSRFSKYVGNIYTEIGNVNHNEELNRFLHNSHLSENKVKKETMRIHRNSYGAGLWEKANYSYLINGLHRINKTLPRKQKVNLYNLDLGIKDWKTANVDEIKSMLNLMPKRDSILANNFLLQYKKQKLGKALVILNFRHAFLKDIFGRENAGHYIAEAYPGKVANVFISAAALANDPEHPMRAIADGYWDASFIKSGKLNIGFNFDDSPFSKTPFDLIPVKNNFVYGDFFTGMVYYEAFPKLRTVCGMKGFVDESFLPEITHRYILEREAIGVSVPSASELTERYNTVTDIYYKEDPAAFVAIEQINSVIDKNK